MGSGGLWGSILTMLDAATYMCTNLCVKNFVTCLVLQKILKF